MNRLALALLSLGLVGSAQAQTNFNMPPPGGVMVIGVQVVATCGVGTLSTTTPGFVTMNQLGQLCTNASGGGGGSVTQGTVPWVDSVHYWGSSDTALGAPSNYGTTPGAVVVPGVNAFVTNVPAVTCALCALESTQQSVLTAIQGAIPAGTAIIGKVGIDQTTPGTTNGVAVVGVNGATALAGNGATGTGSPRVTLSNDNTVPTGWPTAAGQSASQPRVPTAGTTGGATVSSAIAPATPAGVNLKASAGTLYGIQVTTIQATPVYVKFYNSASAPTCGSGTPVARFMVPAAATAANGAGTNIMLPVGVAFGTGLGYCVTGALADNDTTAITANNTLVNIEWN